MKIILGKCIIPELVKFQTFLNLILVSQGRVVLDIQEVNVQALIEHDKAIHDKIKQKQLPLEEHVMILMTRINNYQMMQKLVDVGAPRDVRDSKGRTLMMIAIDENDDQIIENLRKIGILLNQRDAENKTILRLAFEDRNFERMNKLHQHGVSFQERDSTDDLTILQTAFKNKDDEMIKWLCRLDNK